MKLPRVQITVRWLLTAVVGVAIALSTARTILTGEGSPLLGLVMIVACVVCLAVVLESRREIVPAPQNFEGTVKSLTCRAMALAIVLIGFPDAAFVAYYWCRNGGEWTIVPSLHAERTLNQGAMMEGATVAIVVAVLLRCALWSTNFRRSRRLASLCAVALILALLLTGSWLAPRRSYYLQRAAYHHVLEGMHGGAPWAVSTPEFPLDANKAAYHRRMRERYEHAARFPWLSVKTNIR